LLDSLAANQVEPVLLPGMRKLGLDPARVKLVVVAHGHADHFGGSPYFQERGAHVAMSAEDWDFIAPKPGAAVKGPGPPKRDIALVEGRAVGLGDVQITPVLTPGHTPGSMGFIFPVKDGGKTTIAAMFGGTMRYSPHSGAVRSIPEGHRAFPGGSREGRGGGGVAESSFDGRLHRALGSASNAQAWGSESVRGGTRELSEVSRRHVGMHAGADRAARGSVK
jgi:hypothetical protein